MLEKVPKYKYLGLWIDEGLKFEDHIEYIINIFKQKIYLLNSLTAI